MKKENENEWHLKKVVTLSQIISLALFFGGGVMWGVGIEKTLTRIDTQQFATEKRIERFEENVRADMVLIRDALHRIEDKIEKRSKR